MISYFSFDLQPRNKEQEQEVLNWIFAVLGEKVPSGQYEDILKDGIWLCKLANKLAPGSVKKIQERGTNFQLMENIQRFQAAVKKYGVPEEEIFQTADLFERRNIPQVTLSLYALGRIVSSLQGLPRGSTLNTPLSPLSRLDAKASRVHWPHSGTQDGREERAHLHRGATARPRG